MANGKSYPTTVTVLVASHPLLVVNSTPESENSVAVDLVYKEPEDVQTAIHVIRATLQACEYFVWKQTGLLPRPPGMEEQLPLDEGKDTPF